MIVDAKAFGQPAASAFFVALGPLRPAIDAYLNGRAEGMQIAFMLNIAIV